MIPKGFEWVVILIAVLVIFGPKQLPKLGKALGSTVKNLREGMQGDETASEEVVEESEEDREIRELEEKLAEAKKKKEEGSENEGPISE
ncbi:twin-arginine translocase TatA/TatE family subunit [Enorma phocaeensis]|uniref:Sec-independent protein translocase protein TatA n=1 Tax=Enorma phocaeensis TaxID=1871019 RepID=A0A921LSW4_9ACTN|nr:twin-arginine translocase TatA/TatE family subunit [Enorma phocaeensis]HJG36586.1 twin-arginine translocase TatA/TatE family subunit [Enorma phocaeensis]